MKSKFKYIWVSVTQPYKAVKEDSVTLSHEGLSWKIVLHCLMHEGWSQQYSLDIIPIAGFISENLTGTAHKRNLWGVGNMKTRVAI